MREEEYIRLDATALAGLVRGGEVSAIELLELALARLARWNPAINAVVIELAERARRDAAATLPAGPFAGVPFLVKDLDGFLAGAEFTASSRALLGYVPPRDSELFRRYRDAGLVICGKTNTPEFGLVGTTESLLRGPARNPWNPAYSCGGSSGGSAAAVMEEIIQEGGHVRNASFTDYLLPTFLDMPDVVISLIEEPDPMAPLGAKGVGEPPTISSTPAVVAAIRDALGKDLWRVPVRPADICL